MHRIRVTERLGVTLPSKDLRDSTPKKSPKNAAKNSKHSSNTAKPLVNVGTATLPMNSNCGTSTVWTISGTCRRTTTGASTTTLHCGYLCLRRNWNVRHSEEEPSLRHLQLEPLGVEDHRDVHKRRICSTKRCRTSPPPPASATTIQRAENVRRTIFCTGGWVALPKEATPNGQVLKATRRSPITRLD